MINKQQTINKYQLKSINSGCASGYTLPTLNLSFSHLDINRNKPYLFYLNNNVIKSFDNLEIAKKYISKFKRRMNKEVKNLVMTQ